MVEQYTKFAIVIYTLGVFCVGIFFGIAWARVSAWFKPIKIIDELYEEWEKKQKNKAAFNFGKDDDE